METGEMRAWWRDQRCQLGDKVHRIPFDMRGAISPRGLEFVTHPCASAQAAELEESDRTALALGYKHDATKVDQAKYPAYVAGRNCANCQLFAAKGNEAWAPCAAVGNKLANAKGWCVARVKKA